MSAYKKMHQKIYKNKSYSDGDNTWTVVDVGSDGFMIAIDGDLIWEDSIDFSIDDEHAVTYRKDSGGIKHKRYNIPLSEKEKALCEKIKKSLLK
jgi:hypothetical protein